jgi:hypothetical protein
MILFAAVAFLPAQVVHWVARALALPFRAVRFDWQRQKEFVIPWALLAGLFLGVAGHLVDLPGSLVSGLVAAVMLFLAAVWAFLRNRETLALPWVASAAAAAVMMWVSVATSEVRFDYYRFIGGDARRRGEYEAALEAYVKANRYAPEGKDRKEKEEEMRRVLNRPSG